jgi:hypothetical protein
MDLQLLEPSTSSYSPVFWNHNYLEDEPNKLKLLTSPHITIQQKNTTIFFPVVNYKSHYNYVVLKITQAWHKSSQEETAVLEVIMIMIAFTNSTMTKTPIVAQLITHFKFYICTLRFWFLQNLCCCCYTLDKCTAPTSKILYRMRIYFPSTSRGSIITWMNEDVEFEIGKQCLKFSCSFADMILYACRRERRQRRAFHRVWIPCKFISPVLQSSYKKAIRRWRQVS